MYMPGLLISIKSIVLNLNCCLSVCLSVAKEAEMEC